MQFPSAYDTSWLTHPVFCLAFSYSSFTFQLRASSDRPSMTPLGPLSLFSHNTPCNFPFRALIKMYPLHSVSLTSAALWTPRTQGAFLFCLPLYLWSHHHAWHRRCPSYMFLRAYICAAAAGKGGNLRRKVVGLCHSLWASQSMANDQKKFSAVVRKHGFVLSHILNSDIKFQES